MISDLLRCNWGAFNLSAGIKVSSGLLAMLILTHITGESWLSTALVAMFAWMANFPGSLKERTLGLISFAVGAAGITIINGLIKTSVWPNTFAIMVFGFLGTIALVWGMRAFMIGFSLICWAIYGPLMVATTSVGNCLLAILVGTIVVILLNAIGDVLEKKKDLEKEERAAESTAPTDPPLPVSYLMGYAIIVACVLGFTTYFGWVVLETDPSLMAGGAFFVIGFEIRKTWVAGIGRVLGLIGGSLLGLLIAIMLGPGTMLDLVMIVACGLSFAAAGVHPGGWMFFFMVFVAIGWHGMDAATFNLTVAERFYGELVGIAAAMAAILFIRWWDRNRVINQ